MVFGSDPSVPSKNNRKQKVRRVVIPHQTISWWCPDPLMLPFLKLYPISWILTFSLLTSSCWSSHHLLLEWLPRVHSTLSPFLFLYSSADSILRQSEVRLNGVLYLSTFNHLLLLLPPDVMLSPSHLIFPHLTSHLILLFSQLLTRDIECNHKK